MGRYDDTNAAVFAWLLVAMLVWFVIAILTYAGCRRVA